MLITIRILIVKLIALEPQHVLDVNDHFQGYNRPKLYGIK
jgi:hypothetical protein